MFSPVSIFQMIRRAKASALMAASLSFAMALPPSHASDVLIGRAVLPAETFAEGPTSGQQLGANPINGQAVPFVKKQPVQGFSAVAYAGKGRFEVELKGDGQPVKKTTKVDLMNIEDSNRISLPGLPIDVGLGTTFTFPFTTIQDVIVFDRYHIGVLNDNNFPFSIGRHVGSGKPDDNEFIVIRLDKP